MKKREVLCEECGQMVKKVFLPGRGQRMSYDSHLDQNGEPCKGAGWVIPRALCEGVKHV